MTAGDLGYLPWGRLLVDELVESLPDPVIGADADGMIVFWNRAARELYGYSAEEAIGKQSAALLQARAPVPWAEILEEMTDLGRWQGRLSVRTKEGREIAVESRWFARYDDAGSRVGSFGIDRPLAALESLMRSGDRTAGEVQAEADEVRRAERLESLGQLAGGVAHDLNNALAIIINYAALVSNELERLRPAPAESQRAAIRADLQEIQSAAQRAAQLTHELLAFSRQEVGAPVPMALNDAITEIEDLLRHTAGEHIRLVTDLAAELEEVSADPAQIKQVLINLVANARDAMAGGGTLTIETANVALDIDSCSVGIDLDPGRYVRLRISDTGVGMSADVLERVFDPFFTTKPPGYGTGLGLSSVYGIITRAGGHARFHSRPGVGTTFVALLPARSNRVAPAASDAPEAPPAGEPAGTSTILVVEDESALREVTRRILADAGYAVLEADSGENALTVAAAHEGTIDLLLTDIMMPGMLGHHLADRLGAEQRGLRVLYMSGFSEWLLGQATQIGSSALIEKPFTAPALLERVRSALAAKPARS